MTQRRAIVGGNWKMNTNRASAVDLAGEVVSLSRRLDGNCDVAVFPPFTYLDAVGTVTTGSSVILGAQDVYYQPGGAYTGEISTAMLVDLGVQMVLVGHSERRHVLGEVDSLINRKLLASLDAKLQVVLCIGETLEQREMGDTEQVVVGQLRTGLADVPQDAMAGIVIAYEPVWAIGTGRTAEPSDAQAVHKTVRAAVESLYDAAIADSLRIQYGGSVKGNNAQALFDQPDIDGGLIGGASLDAEEFAAIVHVAGA